MSDGAADEAQRLELGRRTRQRLDEALGRVVGERPQPVDGGRPEPLLVGPYDLTTPCPLQLAHPADDYVDRTATVRRRLGLLALRRAWEHRGARGAEDAGTALARAVDGALEEREGWPSGLGQWFSGLGRAGRAAVRAAVLTWCVDVTRLVGTPADGAAGRIRWSDPFMPQRVDLAARAVRLRGGADAVLGGRSRGEALLLVTDAVPGPADRLRAGHLAVVHAAASGRAPVRVTLGSPATGRLEPVPVDQPLLDLAVDRAVEVAGYLADPERATARPGTWCRHCHLLADCAEGAAHLAEDHSGRGDPTM